MAKKTYNRVTKDVGNIIALEHVNVTVPDQSLATYFYVNVMGFTRDPYMEWGPYNVWVNAGRQQFHLPTAKPQVLRGHIGVVVPDLQRLASRLKQMSKRLTDTHFNYSIKKQHITVTCPWGNELRCYPPGKFGQMQLGIPYVELNVPTGSATGIARFYEEIMDCRAILNGKSDRVDVQIGQMQRLCFKESKKASPEYDGHHIAIYVSNFSGPHRKLDEAGRITEESDDNQYRFQTIFDPKTNQSLFDLEHEVRSLHHPMYERVLINRNDAQSFFHYQKDRDAFTPAEQ